MQLGTNRVTLYTHYTSVHVASKPKWGSKASSTSPKVNKPWKRSRKPKKQHVTVRWQIHRQNDICNADVTFQASGNYFANFRTYHDGKKASKYRWKTKQYIATNNFTPDILENGSRTRTVGPPRVRVRQFSITFYTIMARFNYNCTYTFTFSGFNNVFHVINHLAGWQSLTNHFIRTYFENSYLTIFRQPASDLYDCTSFRSLSMTYGERWDGDRGARDQPSIRLSRKI